MGSVCGSIIALANSGLLLWRGLRYSFDVRQSTSRSVAHPLRVLDHYLQGVRKACFLGNALAVVEKMWISLCGSLWENCGKVLHMVVEFVVLHINAGKSGRFPRCGGKNFHLFCTLNNRGNGGFCTVSTDLTTITTNIYIGD